MKAYRFERKICIWVCSHLFLIACIIGTGLSIYIRVNVSDFISPDMEVFLVPWFNEILEKGRIYALREQVGNYGIPYQTIIALMSYLPINPVHGYKIVSIFFDYGLSLIVGLIIRKITGDKHLSAIGYIICLVHPIVFLNSSVWGQCDSIYSFFCVLCLLFFMRKKYINAFLFYGIAFSFKLQAIFLLPFIIYIYIYKTSYSFVNFLIIPLCMIMFSALGILQGRSVVDAFGLYIKQIGTYQRISNNYPSVWNVFVDNFTFNHYKSYSPFCVTVTIIALGLFMMYMMRHKLELTPRMLFFSAFMTTYITVFFLPNMHERYSYLYIILGLIVAFADRRTVLAYVVLVLIDCHTYAEYLFTVTSIPWMVLVGLNISCMMWYCFRFSVLINNPEIHLSDG